MKKQTGIFLLAVVLLGSLLLNPSCDSTTKNNSNSNSASNNSAQSNTNQSVATAPDCSGNGNIKKQKIKDGVTLKIRGNPKLDPQYRANNFYFDPVIEANDEATLYIWGKIYTSANDVDDLNKTYKDFMKRGCVSKVVFTSPPTTTAVSNRFEFNICEAPNQICSDGSCREVCTIIKDDNTNTNSNTKANSNTNTKANAN
jgi:hypothetical protein